MYLHLGQGVVVESDLIVGIFDIDNTTSSHLTREYLSCAECRSSIISVTDDIPKSFIVVADSGRTLVYLSQLTSQTLYKRSMRRGAVIEL